jgi:translocator protein
MEKRLKFLTLIVCFVIVYSVGFFGSIFTSRGIDTNWYSSVRPDITPPAWVFPIVWNVLFFLIGISLYLAWTKSEFLDKIPIGLSFGLNLTFNFLWTVFYFDLQKPLWAFVDLVFLWISIIFMMFAVWKVSRKSAWLLVPYLLWVSFASVLNFLSIK